MLSRAGVRSRGVRNGLGALLAFALVLLALVGSPRSDSLAASGMELGAGVTTVGRIERGDGAAIPGVDDSAAPGRLVVVSPRPPDAAPARVCAGWFDAARRCAASPLESVGPRGPPR